MVKLRNKFETMFIDQFKWGKLACPYFAGDLDDAYQDKLRFPEDSLKGIQWRDVVLMVAENCTLSFKNYARNNDFINVTGFDQYNLGDRIVLLDLENINFFRQFVPNLSEYTAPLTDLIKDKAAENTKIEHTEASRQAFESLKQHLIRLPKIFIYDPDKTTYIFTPQFGSCYWRFYLPKAEYRWN
ncbi:uncharacterized protein J8A68_003685 [[Candida] subhashii]|uniref:Uncharacterized protein n=1 Tax=[Candida] subhashii TaxID=561895 RepID=A0A8J5QV56_9ASCO|nr:uncharacterized protein J8A68_003685 [[Candida] subhashii]KAG7662830.1 hypothetical protein J8A68_003685 [[Candida] subhashii]